MEPEELRKHLKKGFIIAGFFALALVLYALRWRWAMIAYIVVVGLAAVLAILLQSGRGGGLAASLGGLGGDSLLGTHSATPIAKATYVLLALFVFTCIMAGRMPVSAREGAVTPVSGAAHPSAPAPFSSVPAQTPEEGAPTPPPPAQPEGQPAE
jgi:protein translocase SecG subunit